ncbi:MAG: dolichyl-phosphate beta-glucosyltransferase [Candidatus Paceibacterota bacterium]|jgi:glycosyltransferase involved in cell wall biosynthesis
MKPYLSIIIPAYNEAKRLPQTLVDIDHRLQGVDFSYEIIVVDDGSKDATVQVAKKFSGMIKNLRVIENQENKGKGGVVKQGMLEAKGNIRLFDDADNSTSIDHFFKMIDYFKEGYGVVIGSRDIKGAKFDPPQPFYKRLFGEVGNLIIQTLLLPGIRDTQCGFKAFTEEAAEKIFPLTKITRWSLDVEVLSLAKQLGYRIKEIPVLWKNDADSRVKGSTYIQFFTEVLKIRMWLWQDAYKIKDFLKIKNLKK